MSVHKKAIHAIDDMDRLELAIGYLRYEALRKLKPREFLALHKRNMAGELFDGMVDELIENDGKLDKISPV